MDAALAYARLFDASRDDFERGNDLYCAVIYMCGRAKDWRVAHEAFRLRRDEADATPDRFAYSALVSAAGKCGNAKAAREAFEEANAVGEVDTVVYNAYIDVCAGRGDYEGALETLERMKKTPDVAPNIRSYNGVISASTRQKNFTGAVAAWEEIKRAKDLEPTKITYGAMLAAGAAADDVDVEWSEQLFDEAIRSGACGPAGNDHMVSSMLSAYARGIVLGQITADVAMTRAESLVRALVDDAALDERRAARTPNSRVWCALITLCARSGRPARAIEVLNIMKSRTDADKDEYMMYALTSALEASKEGKEHFARMKDVVNDSPPSVRHSTGVRNGMISTHLHFGDFKSAFELYGAFKEDMRAYRRDASSGGERERRELEHRLPDTITYNTLIYACASNGEDGKAMEMYSDMLVNGIPPSLRTYVGLIVALGRSNKGSRAEEAEKLFDAAIDDGIRPNEFLFTSLMDAQVKANRPSSAFETYERMKTDDVNRTTVTYGCALQACCYFEDTEEGVERAYEVLRDMTERDVKMNDWCSNTFLRVISSAGRIEEMLEEVKNIARRKGKLEQETIEAIVRALCLEGYVERAYRFLSMMDSRGLEPSEHTLKEFVVSCSREGFVDRAWEAYTRLTRLGHTLDVATRSSLVTVLSVASTSPDPDDAELLLARAIGVFDTGTKRTAADEEILDAEARCALVVATARSEQLDRALSIWRAAPALSSFSRARKHTTNESKDYIGDTRAMYECLIEVCCHQDRVDDALEVFDHIKDAGARVGTVTLAFLESSCRRSRVEEWRMFDVCAQMRAQADEKLERHLAKPSKLSHHVGASLNDEDDASDIADELATDGLRGEIKKSSWRRPKS
jgi:pentatricopeptide repeat protein